MLPVTTYGGAIIVDPGPCSRARPRCFPDATVHDVLTRPERRNGRRHRAPFPVLVLSLAARLLGVPAGPRRPTRSGHP